MMLRNSGTYSETGHDSNFDEILYTYVIWCIRDKSAIGLLVL